MKYLFKYGNNINKTLLLNCALNEHPNIAGPLCLFKRTFLSDAKNKGWLRLVRGYGGVGEGGDL